MIERQIEIRAELGGRVFEARTRLEKHQCNEWGVREACLSLARRLADQIVKELEPNR